MFLVGDPIRCHRPPQGATGRHRPLSTLAQILSNTWKTIEINEKQLKSMRIYENLLKSMTNYENLSKSMKIQGYMRSAKGRWVIFYIPNIQMPHICVPQAEINCLNKEHENHGSLENIDFDM
jgi:hypothetical protein